MIHNRRPAEAQLCIMNYALIIVVIIIVVIVIVVI